MKKNERPKLFGHQSRLTWNEILIGLATLGVGIVLTIWPQIAEEIVMTTIGVIGVIIGLSYVVRYALLDVVDAIDSNSLVYGLMWVAGGILIIVLRKLLVALLPILLGFYVLFCGLSKVHITLNMKRMRVNKWFLELANACFSIIVGTVIICRPFTTAYFLMRFVGIGLITEGLLDFISKYIYCGIHDNYMRVYAYEKYNKGKAEEKTAEENTED